MGVSVFSYESTFSISYSYGDDYRDSLRVASYDHYAYPYDDLGYLSAYCCCYCGA